MKKQWKGLLTLGLVCGLLAGQCAAFKMTELPAEDIFSPEIIEKETVSEWARSEIEAARTAGLVTPGCSSYMTHNITRQQFAELSVNLVEVVKGEKLTPAAADTFTDCEDEAVLKASAAGIVNGVGGGLFDPYGGLTREQLAAMLYRTWTVLGDQAPAAGLEGYTDADSVSSWAADAVGALAASGIMKGTSETTLTPQGPCTIEQSILLVYRLYQQVDQ